MHGYHLAGLRPVGGNAALGLCRLTDNIMRTVDLAMAVKAPSGFAAYEHHFAARSCICQISVPVLLLLDTCGAASGIH